MNTKRQDYTCPRCGYHTSRKECMRRHLYQNKRPCPTTSHDIDLTDDIKQYILDNRIYKVPTPQQPPTLVQSINTYNTMNNFVANMDTMDKLSTYLKFTGTNPIPLEDRVDDMFSDRYAKLKNDQYLYGYELSIEDIYDIIDEISQIDSSKKIENLNVIYEETNKKVYVFDGEWKQFRLKCAIKTLIHIIKSGYTNAYEAFLIRRLKNTSLSPFKKQQSKELLSDYYRFLAANEVLPGVNDDSASGDIDSLDDEVREEYHEFYKSIQDKLTLGEKNKTFKEVVYILQRNTKKNVDDLNKKIIGLIQIDEDFKNNILTFQHPSFHNG